MKRFNPEKELNKVQYGDRKKLIGIIAFLLVIIAVGSTYALYQVRHTQKLVFNTVGEFKKRDIYLSVLVDGEYQNDFPTQEEGMLYGGYECDGSATINFDTDKWQVALYASHPDKCTIKFGHKYVDESGANYPELYQGMIPVYFENGKIYVADVTSKWYNYDEHEWANAVLIDNTNETAKSKFYDDNGNLLGGHEVSEDDILQMYVWIPRYKYQLFNVNNEEKPEQIINVEFERDIANTGDIKCTYKNLNNGTIEESCLDKQGEQASNGKWYTHPAFTFKGTFEENGTELKGIWVGKFTPSHTTKSHGNESSDVNASLNCSDNNCKEANNIRILPNKATLRYNNLSNYFYASLSISQDGNLYNLKNTEVDTHLMKSIEWGATAYLTQSKYGLFFEDNHTCANGLAYEICEVYINNNTDYITGCAGNTVSEAGSTSCNEWLTLNGQKASNTGNLYGIYDMSGGSPEYNMGNMVDSTGLFNLGNSGFNKDKLPETKYYDEYSIGTSELDSVRGHLGDSTRETIKQKNAQAGGWYNDMSRFVANGVNWIIRNGNPINGRAAGIFYFYPIDGRAQTNAISFRIVLTAQDGED